MENKFLKITTYFFAVIGVVCVLGACVFGVMRLVNTVSEKHNSVAAESESDTSLEEAILNETINTDENSEVSSPVDEMADISNSETSPEEKSIYDVLNEDGELSITFLGDSILDNFRDETGICNIISNSLDATVYNLGIGGCSATIPRENSLNEPAEGTVSGSVSGVMLAHIMAGDFTLNAIYDCTAKSILAEHFDDIKNSDIFVVEYGINDFRCGRDTANPDDGNDPTTFVGAIRQIVYCLQRINPDAIIILCEPSYTYYYRDNGEYIGDSYTLDNGLGALVDYGGKTEYVSNELGTYLYKLKVQGIDSEQDNMIMDDGTHLNELGRRVYAENLLAYMKRHEIIKDYEWSGESHEVDINALEW